MEPMYIILRPCLFFAKDETVSFTRLRKWFTPAGIQELKQCGYIELKPA